MNHVITAAIVIAGMLLTSAPSFSQDTASFSLRGTLISTQVNFFTGFREGRIKLPFHPPIYVVNCQTQPCSDFISSNIGQHIATVGQAMPINQIQSQTQELLLVDTFGYASGARATFFFTGILTGYTPPHVSSSGLPEFDLTVDGNEVHHLICDPLYVGCNSRIQLSLGQCVAPVGDMESTSAGFLGDTVMFLWTTHIYTGQTCD